MAYMPDEAKPWAAKLQKLGLPRKDGRPGDGKACNRVARLLHANGIEDVAAIGRSGNPWTWKNASRSLQSRNKGPVKDLAVEPQTSVEK